MATTKRTRGGRGARPVKRGKPAAKKQPAKKVKAPARTHAAAKKAPARKKAAPKRKVAARRKPTAKKRGTSKPVARRRTAPARKALHRAVRRTTTGAPAATALGLTDHVTSELAKRGLDASPDVVATIAAVGLGYRQGPAQDPPFLTVALDIDALVAEALVERYDAGNPPAGIDRDMHRTTTRATVSFNLAQHGLDDAGDVVRDTLASMALGTWRPGFDEHARRNAVAGFLVAWYRAGRT